MRRHNGDQRVRKRFIFRGRRAWRRHSRHFCSVRSVSKHLHCVGRSDLSAVPFTRGHRCDGTDDEPGPVVRRSYRRFVHDSGKTYGPLFLAIIGFVSIALLLRSSERFEQHNRL